MEPAQEWFVVIASMQAKGIGEVTRVADISAALNALGITAAYGTIVSELERVGLARSSHDADDAVAAAAF